MKVVFKYLIHIIWWKPIQFCKLCFILIFCCTLCQYLTLVWLHLSTCRSWFLVYEGSSELKGYIIWHRRFFNQFYVPLPRSGKMVSGRSRHGKTQQIYTSNVCAKIILPKKVCKLQKKSEFSTKQCNRPKVPKSAIKKNNNYHKTP